MDFTQLPALIAAHKWFALSALVVWTIVRLLKSDTKLPVTIPARWRPVLALGLGFVAGALDKIASGTPWKQAVTWGLGVGVAAILAQTFGVDVMRDGREISVGPLMLTSAELPTKPHGLDSKGRVRMSLVLALFVGALVLGPIAAILSGCQLLAKDATDALKTEACIVAQVDKGQTSFEDIAQACGGLAVQDVIDIVNTIVAAESRKGDAGIAASEPTPLHKALLGLHHK